MTRIKPGEIAQAQSFAAHPPEMLEVVGPSGAAAVHLERALERGDLDMAVASAKDVTREYGQPIRLELAVRFLPLVAVQRPEAYDAWALRWLARWSTESTWATIEGAAQVAAALANLPAEPSALNTIRQATSTA
jgi:hypothetical protein